MALVRHAGGRLAALATLGSLANTIYRNRNTLQAGFDMAKRTYNAAFGPTTSRRGGYKRIRRHGPTHRLRRRKRYTRRTKAQRILNPKKNRRRGRRVPPNRDIILRTTQRKAQTFLSHGPDEVDFNSELVEMDTPGAWFPGEHEVTIMDKCRFDGCNTKRIKSVHVYMKNISVTTWYDKPQNKQIVSQPNDTYVFTYADQRATNIGLVDTQGKYIRNQGLSKKLIRNQADYHSVVKGNCFARNTYNGSFDALKSVAWKDFTISQDFFNKTGETRTTNGQYLNIDWLINVDVPYNPPEQGSVFYAKVEFDTVVATKWRLYGTKEHPKNNGHDNNI